MWLKGAAIGPLAFLVKAIFWIGRHLVLPLAIKTYRFVVKIRRTLLPAQRRFVLVATHRGILHGVLFAVVLTTAGGNIYAQTQSTISSGEDSVMYKYLSGESDVVEQSGPPSEADIQYMAGVVDSNATVPPNADSDSSDSDQGPDTMIELGSLMPEIVPGAPAPVHRTQIEEYVVADGDTLSEIANKFGISIATILWANNLTVRDFIQPKQKLKILPTTGIVYTVKNNDTISKIAAAYGIDPIEIKSWNNIVDEATLQKGQDIILPGGKVIVPAAPKPVVKPATKPKPATTTTKVIVKVPDASDAGDTDLLWPTAARILTQYFGVWNPMEGRHTGLDFGAPLGTPIYAADDGIVTHSGCGARGCKKSYGYYVDIDHGNGIMTRYGHSSKLLVKAGDQVHRGQVIALMGSTGLSTGSHLHFEVRVNGVAKNPLPFIR